jgi:hypothetical protein
MELKKELINIWQESSQLLKILLVVTITMLVIFTCCMIINRDQFEGVEPWIGLSTPWLIAIYLAWDIITYDPRDYI